MSDDDDLDAPKQHRRRRADHARGEEPGHAREPSQGAERERVGKQTLVESSSSGRNGHSVASSLMFFERSVNAAHAEMTKLAAAIAAIDFSQALVSTTVLPGHLRTARSRVAQAATYDPCSPRTLAELERDAEALLVKAPRMSAEALGSKEKWRQEADAWRAQRTVDRAQKATSDAGRDGAALPDAIRGELEVALGASLRDVRLHAGPKGQQLAARHHARAVADGTTSTWELASTTRPAVPAVSCSRTRSRTSSRRGMPSLRTTAQARQRGDRRRCRGGRSRRVRCRVSSAGRRRAFHTGRGRERGDAQAAGARCV